MVLAKFTLILLMLLSIVSHFFSLPGNIIILGLAVIYGLFTGFAELQFWDYFLLSGLVIAGEVMENFFALMGARRYGSSTAGMVAAFIGGIIGALVGAAFLLGLGAIPGLFIGAFLGTTVVELYQGKDFKSACRAGTGAFWGRAFGIFFKIIIGLTMIVLTSYRLFY